MTSIDPRTYQAIDEALDDAGQTTRVTVVEAIVAAIKDGRIPGLTTCDIPPPYGQMREDADEDLWVKINDGSSSPWQNVTTGEYASDAIAAGWKVVWTPGDEARARTITSNMVDAGQWVPLGVTSTGARCYGPPPTP